MCKNRKYTRSEQTIINNLKANSINKCYYCNKIITNKEDFTVDHIVPISRGGKTLEKNLVISCKNCNREKDNMTEKEYIQYLKVKKDLKEFYNIIANKEVAIKQCNIIINNIQKNISKNIKNINFERTMQEIKEPKSYFERIYGNKILTNPKVILQLKQNSYPKETKKIISINDIVIKNNYKMTPPKVETMKEKIDYFLRFKQISAPIVLNYKNELENGYCNYILLKELGVKIVPIKYKSIFNNLLINLQTKIGGILYE